MKPGHVVFALLLAVGRLSANVSLPSIIGDNMVLQRNTTCPIWGWATPGEQIRITGSWDNSSHLVTCSSNGKWTAKLDTLSAGGPYTIKIEGQNTISLRNVMLGEVWLASGQSNMDFAMTYLNSHFKGVIDYPQEIAAANYPNIRLITVPYNPQTSPQEDFAGQWQQCSSSTVAHFSAVAYYFAQKLHNELNIPIGIIQSSRGATRVDTWTSTSSEPLLFNGMIAPLTKYKLKGAIWYQGEGNAAISATYYKEFPTLITDWRKHWGYNFPFHYVQLASLDLAAGGYGETSLQWANIRDAQLQTLNLENTAMAVITDTVDDLLNIHPQNKKPVGYRLALPALAKLYGRDDIVYSGPIYKGMRIEGNKIRIYFEHIGGGLKIKGGKLTRLTDFVIAGEDKVFQEAIACIEGDTIVVWNHNISSPVAVRFGYSCIAQPNLFNVEGLPASPFRTDCFNTFNWW